MGIFKKQNKGLGVELGEDSAKALLLEEVRGRMVVRNALYLSRFREGFLNEREMRQDFAEWLVQRDIPLCNAAGNLSQHLTLEAVYDFPPELRWGTLRKMVEFQTQSLCGITEENFICGAQKLDAHRDGRNRILIAASRETVIDSCFDNFIEAGANVRMMAENGQALANAFIGLHPGDFMKDEMQMILNLDRDNTALVLFKEGKILYVTGLALAGDIFAKCIMQCRNCDDYQAERELPDYEPDWNSPASPFFTALGSLIAELNAVRMNWRQNGNGGKQADTSLQKLWLTGGGAQLRGLAEQMGQLLACDVQPFGVPAKMLANSGIQCPTGLDFHPHLTLAYGLALQAMNRSALTISLLPRQFQKKIRHAGDFPFLCAGLACVLALVITMLCAWSADLNRRIRTLEEQRDQLTQCQEIIPKIQAAHKELRLRYRRLLPLLEYGRRSHLFVQALINCQRVFRDSEPERLTAWGIYLADAFSFAEEQGLQQQEDKEAEPAESRKKYLVGTAAEKRGAGKEKGTFLDRTRIHPPKNLCAVQELNRLDKMYLAGITRQDDARFETLKKIQENFTLENLFANVDDYTDAFRDSDRPEQPRPWREFLRKHKDRLHSSYAIFLLQLPFLDTTEQP